MNHATPFARHGCEKMIYDIRMGPQCIQADGMHFAAYLAGPAAGGKALPHIIRRDRSGAWGEPVALGDVPKFDHHFAPVLWVDADGHVHVLSHCHASLHGSRHVVSSARLSVEEWRDAPEVAPSISYPRIVKLPGGRLLLYHRVLGHMGYWTYQVSDDGGFSWKRRGTPLVDFDQRPEAPGDEWSGSYHSVAPGKDGESLHLAFVYWDERKQVHPVYGVRLAHMDRYHLFYARVDIASGRLYTVSGRRLGTPVNRREAEKCLVWDTGTRLTNMPSVLVERNDRPAFLMPVSGDRVDDCAFWFIRREKGTWERFRVTDTNSTWAGSHLEADGTGGISAFLVGRPVQAGNLPYGGGVLQEWRTRDRGESWEHVRDILPKAGLVCNNPKPVETATGEALRRTLVFFGWEGPHGLAPEGPYGGQAFLWRDGEWL
mgnify:CR=1 FL=1